MPRKAVQWRLKARRLATLLSRAEGGGSVGGWGAEVFRVVFGFARGAPMREGWGLLSCGSVSHRLTGRDRRALYNKAHRSGALRLVLVPRYKASRAIPTAKAGAGARLGGLMSKAGGGR